VEGPRSAVANLRSAITEPISVAGASATLTELVTVGVADPSVRLTSRDPVQVTVNITPAQLQWAVAGIPVEVVNGEAERKVSVMPAMATAYVRGPRDAMAGAVASAFDVTVDVGGLRPGEYELPVRVGLPARIGLVRVQPAEVRVRIR